MQLFSLFLGLSLSFTAAAESLKASKLKTPVYGSPSESGKIVHQLQKGKTVEAEGDPENGFYKLKTKTGRSLYVREQDVEREGEGEGIEDDLEVGKKKASKNEKSFKRFHFDIGGSTGISSGSSFYEVNLGLTYSFTEWLSWRNAPFYRTQSGTSDTYGLDTSLRARYTLSIAPDLSPSVHAGAGFRFVNTGSHAPFGELGLGVRLAGISINAGIKYIAGKLINSSYQNEMIFTGGFSGSGSF